ncbi:MAG: helix-turn-helix domain-containing protein [Microthrixaceae bacterium]|nr:helix-turn-helix domain-containing protein [Microthrixaceae bacterium]
MQRILNPLSEGWEALGIGRTKFLELVDQEEIPTVRIGRRRLVSTEALEEYAAKLAREQSAELPREQSTELVPGGDSE